MNGFLILTGVIALCLLVYLFISLIKPEWFG
jgi:K+-transporting ATPase KdpF subunit